MSIGRKPAALILLLALAVSLTGCANVRPAAPPPPTDVEAALMDEGKRLVEDGDIIDIDIPARQISLRVAEDILVRRKTAFVAPQRPPVTGYLRRYAALVSSADRGAVLALEGDVE